MSTRSEASDGAKATEPSSQVESTTESSTSCYDVGAVYTPCRPVPILVSEVAYTRDLSHTIICQQAISDFICHYMSASNK